LRVDLRARANRLPDGEAGPPVVENEGDRPATVLPVVQRPSRPLCRGRNRPATHCPTFGCSWKSTQRADNGRRRGLKPFGSPKGGHWVEARLTPSAPLGRHGQRWLLSESRAIDDIVGRKTGQRHHRGPSDRAVPSVRPAIVSSRMARSVAGSAAAVICEMVIPAPGART